MSTCENLASVSSAHTSSDVVGAVESIIKDAACRRCGYNLRGTSVEGRCPECGTAAGVSVQGDYLRYADPRWVESLARGVKFMLWGIVIGLLLSVTASVIRGFVSPILRDAARLMRRSAVALRRLAADEPRP